MKHQKVMQIAIVFLWGFASTSMAQLPAQLGADIDGEAADDESGYSISLSADGTRLAVGAPGNNSNAGHVRVYEWDSMGMSWTQLGVDIDAEAAGDDAGFSVSLSADGTRLAVGAPSNDGNGVGAGHVRVYEWNSMGMSWTQLGTDIDGEAVNDWSGYSVSLSADGTSLAVGANRSNGNGTDAGHVRVYEWNSMGMSWTQLGADIDGEAAEDWSGYSVSLSADGARLAVGANRNDGNGSDAGHVRVYEWDSGGMSWTQLGMDIDGEAADDLSGISVSLSADGTRLAVGANGNDGNGSQAGHVRVHEWDSKGMSWTQMGSDIDGEAADDVSGWSVSLSADGTRLAIGAPFNSGNGGSSGHTRLYEWDSIGMNWRQLVSDIDGEAAGDASGWSVSLSANDTRLAIGAPNNDDNGGGAGHVRVYEWGLIFKSSFN